MLHFLLKWKSYRTFKNGLLLDFLTKRFFHKISNYFFYIFTIFFGDKYILEHFVSNFSIFFNTIASKLKHISKDSFIKAFKVTIFVVSYIMVVALVFYIV